MAAKALDDVIEATRHLTPEEIRELIAHLNQRLAEVRPRRKWAEIAGKAPYPLTGEDAQEWISRTRREASRKRERLKKELTL
ncbi:MAG: hypothetical protein NZL85_06650 [Fimbriimonadales bacterium]|nr:hypothetical protein [Fimbriimonadales bacterium]